jgi:hypothetical protein
MTFLLPAIVPVAAANIKNCSDADFQGLSEDQTSSKVATADHDNHTGPFEELSTDLRIYADYSEVFICPFAAI